jgi:hypothetical protein
MPSAPAEELHPAFKVPIHELASSSKDELIQKLNANARDTNYGKLVLFGLPILAIFILCSPFVLGLDQSIASPTPLGSFLSTFHPILASALLITGIALGGLWTKNFRDNHTHVLTYDLDAVANARFEQIKNGVNALSQCRALWQLNSQQATYDRKRNAGASTLISRKPIGAGTFKTRGFTCNVEVLAIVCDGTIFYFLPDHILLLSGDTFASIRYEEIQISVQPTRYIEDETPPSDAEQVGTTWRYVNKNGGPDRRFNDNRQLPILRYGEVSLSSLNGMQVIIQTSNFKLAEEFGSFIASSPRKETRTSHPKPSPRTDVKKAYALLEIVPPVSIESATAAYKHQASLYHPDKYEHLAPDIKAIASSKMAEINAAFALVKADIEKRT